VLFTDKTGTLTEGHIRFESRSTRQGAPHSACAHTGARCNEATLEARLSFAANRSSTAPLLDLCGAGDRRHRRVERGSRRPSTTSRQLCSARPTVLAAAAPCSQGEHREAILARCGSLPWRRSWTSCSRRQAGRCGAVRPATGLDTLIPAEERDFDSCGFLTFADRPKAERAASLERLAKLGVIVKVVTATTAAEETHRLRRCRL